MRKELLYVMIFFALSFENVAQPILTAADFDGNVSVEMHQLIGYGFVSTTHDGTTDYSTNATASALARSVTVPLSSVPNTNSASNFSLATYAVKTTYSTGENMHMLFKVTDTEIRAVAGTGYDGALYNNETVYFNFPFSLGQVSPLYGQYVDYFPTVVTPFGTYSNVILLYKHEAGNRPNDWPIDVTYWVATNPFRIILSSWEISGPWTDSYVIYNNSNNLAVSEQIGKSAFSVFPNPSNGDFTIFNKNAFTTDAVLSVYDLLGNTLLTNQKLNEDFNNINLSNFRPGLYIIKITNKENQVLYTEKIIKQ